MHIVPRVACTALVVGIPLLGARASHAMCESVPGTTRQLLTDQALVTNAQIYGAVGLYESSLVPALADPGGKDFHFTLQANSIYNVLTLPSNCDAEPTMHHLDITATAWGFTYQFTDGVSVFYSTAITASASVSSTAAVSTVPSADSDSRAAASALASMSHSTTVAPESSIRSAVA